MSGRSCRMGHIESRSEVRRRLGDFVPLARRLRAALLRIFRAERRIPGWSPSCPSVAMPYEVVMGRALAFYVHPVAAWRRLPTSHRALLLAAYASAGYLIVLAALFIA